MSEPRKVLEFAEGYKDDVDILINNAGISQRDEFVNVSMDVVNSLINVNTLSPIALTKGLLPMMIARNAGGQIVNVLSITGLLGTTFRTCYSASKFALDGFGKAL